MQILNCDNLISSCCSDYGLAKILAAFSNIIQIIHIVVPLLLMVMAVITFTQMMAKPDDDKIKSKLKNEVIATIIVFFIPTFMNVVLNLLPNSFNISSCLKAAKNLDTISRNNEVIYRETTKTEKSSIYTKPDEYQKGDKKQEKEKKWNFIEGDTSSSNTQNNDSNKNNEKSDSSSSNNNSSSNNSSSNNSSSSNSNSTISQSSSSNGKGPILLIAGHSYSPYCKQYSDCRGKASSGYAEEDETRKLVKLIKSNLDSLNVRSDIANALLAGDNDKMNKSFFIESKSNSDLFKKFDWTKYSFVLEVHFNAVNGSAKGTLLCKKSSSYSTKADDDIVKAVTKHTGNSRLGDSIQGLNNVSYFTKRNIPITYLETEFYDNASAMKVYEQHINEIAHDIAVAIKKHYG